MEKRFIVPVSTMLIGLGLWLTYIIAHAFSSTVKNWSVRADLAVAIIISSLIVFSGLTCLRAQGPAVGQVIRAGLLLVIAAFTYWKISAPAAIVLLLGVLVLVFLAVVAFAKQSSE